MNIQYTYEVVSVDEAARCMEIVYSSEGHQTMHIGARLPYEGESVEDVVKMFEPTILWAEKTRPVLTPQVGVTGTVVSATGQHGNTPTPLTDDAARARRNRELADSDWTALVDAPLTQAERDVWMEYRQLLRDVPQQSGFPDSIVWPISPAQEPR